MDFMYQQSTIRPGRECGKPPCRGFLHTGNAAWKIKDGFPSPSGQKGRGRQIEIISGQTFYLQKGKGAFIQNPEV